MRLKGHPKRNKYCVFCYYWTGDAQTKFVDPYSGYEYENTARGHCMKRNLNMLAGGYCNNFEPSAEAQRLL